MKIHPVTTLLEPVCYLPSPNQNERPENVLIDMVVIHGISLPPGQFGNGSIEKFFCNQLDFAAHPYFSSISTLRVSSHLLIARDGAMTQFVPFAKRAWHAGASCFKGRENCNDFSIGIELEGTDELPYTAKQYQQLAQVLNVLMKNYPAMTRDHIVGHSDIAPGRKTDPGAAFDWDNLDCLLQQESLKFTPL